MGNCWGIFRRRRIRRHIVLILIGLDNAGKTKTVNNLAGENDDKVLPTVGFKAVNLVHKDTPVTIYDLGGGPQFRQIWSQYYSEVHGVIFVIDSSDFSRLEECKVVLEEVLSHDKISGKPVLVLANKQDKSGALDDIDVVEKLNIEPLVNKYRCPTLVESYTAEPFTSKASKRIDPGLRKGYHWLLDYIVRRYGDINLRVQTDIHAELERRRLMMARSSQGSQTSTPTGTGFENPNYEAPESAVVGGGGGAVLVVKPVRASCESTVTVESVDDSDCACARPRLSPLVGVQAEARGELGGKLPPVVRSGAGVDRIDFKNRPQSSPTYKSKLPLSQNSSIAEVSKPVKDVNLSDASRALDCSFRRHRVMVNDVELTQTHREIVLTEREHSKAASTDGISAASALTLSARPASASLLVRRQLEVAHPRRRLSLRYMHRNKTSPERAAIALYEPTKLRQLEKGDFEHAATIN